MSRQGRRLTVDSLETRKLMAGDAFASADVDRFLGGVNVAAGDVSGDELSDIITGAGRTNQPNGFIYDGDGSAFGISGNTAGEEGGGLWNIRAAEAIDAVMASYQRANAIISMGEGESNLI